EGVLTEQDVEAMTEHTVAKYERVLAKAKQIATEKPPRAVVPDPIVEEDGSEIFQSGVPASTLKIVADKISLVPDGFHINPKMVSQLARRAKMGEGEIPMDWAFGEAMSFGSLVLEGYPVRISGQGSGRGTFSQRHSSMYDTMTGTRWTPLSELKNDANPKARFYV